MRKMLLSLFILTCMIFVSSGCRRHPLPTYRAEVKFDNTKKEWYYMAEDGRRIFFDARYYTYAK